MKIIKRSISKFFIFTACILICTGSGYKGSLPDIESNFEYARTNVTKESKPLFKTINEYEKNPRYKKVPRENPQYIDIILKKDKTSPYINDLNDVILILEKMQKCIENKGSVQKFNAIASSIIDHADYMAEKYENRPEKYYISFVKLQDIANQARAIATLRCESQVYIKYLTYQGEGQIYSKDSIQRQIDIFADELDKAIKILKDST